MISAHKFKLVEAFTVIINQLKVLHSMPETRVYVFFFYIYSSARITSFFAIKKTTKKKTLSRSVHM